MEQKLRMVFDRNSSFRFSIEQTIYCDKFVEKFINEPTYAKS